MQVVAGDRRTGKTTELIRIAEEKAKYGAVLYITPNFMQRDMVRQQIDGTLPKELASRIKVISVRDDTKVIGLHFNYILIDNADTILCDSIPALQTNYRSGKNCTISVDTTVDVEDLREDLYIFPKTGSFSELWRELERPWLKLLKKMEEVLHHE